MRGDRTQGGAGSRVDKKRSMRATVADSVGTILHGLLVRAVGKAKAKEPESRSHRADDDRGFEFARGDHSR